VNYETQMIALWIDNDKATSKFWRKFTDTVVHERWWVNQAKFDFLHSMTTFTDRDRCTAVLRSSLKARWMDECYDGVEGKVRNNPAIRNVIYEVDGYEHKDGVESKRDTVLKAVNLAEGCYSLQEPFKTILMGAMSMVSWQEIAEYLIEGLVEGGDYPSTWDDEG